MLDNLNKSLNIFFSSIKLSSINPAKIESYLSVEVSEYNADFLKWPELIAGNIKSINNNDIDARPALCRMLISYSLAKDMTENIALFYYHFTLIVNHILLSLTRSIGNLQSRKLDFYFVENSNCVAYELRVKVI